MLVRKLYDPRKVDLVPHFKEPKSRQKSRAVRVGSDIKVS